jgi:hypothetical protein
MANELIITSVRKGLDGGSGYQPVLRTRGMKLAVAERLQIRSGYSHPYAHGNQRNPVIFVHRVERVAGERLNVLARICDAGSDHTGRSNFLAHLVAIPEAETRRMAAGPADVARRFTFKGLWNEPAREADPPTLIAADRAPAPCAAWQAAGLDPGIAGDLAEAAASGTEVRLIVREGDDVLALFTEALALVPPAKRWQVTFNTCEIEPFDAVWRAVREDLPQARAARGGAGVIDLTAAGAKGSDRDYARFARGEAVSLPWQTAAAPAAPTPPPEVTTARPGSGNETATLPSDRRTPAAAASSRETRIPPASGPPRRPAGKRNFLEKVGSGREFWSEADSEPPPRSGGLHRWLLTVIAVTAALALVAIAGVLLRPDARRAVAALFRPDEAAGDKPEKPIDDGNKPSAPGEEERKKQLAAEADARAKAKAEAEAEREKQKAAAAELAKKHEEEKRQREMTERQQEAEAKQKKLDKLRAQAIAEFQALPTVIPKDLMVKSLDSDATPIRPVVLGKLNAEHLEGLSFAIAVPKEKLGSSDFEAWIEPVKEKKGEWEILTNFGTEDRNVKPSALATLSVATDEIRIEPKAAVMKRTQFCLLRRSVLLVSARDPEAPDSDKPAVKAIQLCRPVRPKKPFERGALLEKILGDDAWFNLPIPEGIAASLQQKLPAANVAVEYEVQFDYEPTGEKKVSTAAGTLSGSELESGRYHPLLQLMVPEDPKTTIGVEIAVSLQDGKVRVLPKAIGPGAAFIDPDKVAKEAKKLADGGDKLVKDLETSVTNLVNALKRSTPADFPKAGQDNFEKLLRMQEKNPVAKFTDYGGDFGSFLVREKAFEKLGPDPNDKNKTVPVPVTDPGECFKIWNERCRDIVELPQKDTKSDDVLWKKEFTERLEDWLADWKPRLEDHVKKLQRFLRPCISPVRISIKRITTKAFAEDDTEYTVVLSEPQAPGTSDGKSLVE